MNKFLMPLICTLIVSNLILFYLYFDYVRKDKPVVRERNNLTSGTITIAYFDLDSLEKRYDYLKEVTTQLKKKDAENSKFLKEKQDEYFKKVREYQQKGSALSQMDQTKYEQELMQMQDRLRAVQQQRNQEMNMENLDQLQQVRKKIQQSLKKFCESRGYTYLFASNDEDFWYYKDSLRNVTNDVVQFLNNNYKNSEK